MKKILSAGWKILVLTIVFFVLNAVFSLILPQSNDLLAHMSPKERPIYFPLYIVKIISDMVILYLVWENLALRGWKLFFATWMLLWGVFNVVNVTELYWYNEAFPLYSYGDVTKLLFVTLFACGGTTLLGTWLVGGFKREEQESQIRFDSGKYGWKVILFCLIYPPFYFMCGFIPWAFAEIRAFYETWALTSEPNYVLLLFNIIRGALWLIFSLPILGWVRTRKAAYFLMPLALFGATSVAMIMPSASMPAIVRFGHFIELTVSMVPIGLFMVWLFVKERNTDGQPV